MFIALGIYIGTSIFCALATSMEALIVGRVLQGLGGGGLMTLSQALIGEAVAPRERAKYQGFLSTIAVTSSILGPLVGGILTEAVGWRSIFLVNLPVGVIAVFLTMRLRPVRPDAVSRRFDALGLAFFIGFIVPLLLAMERLQTTSDSGMMTAVTLLLVSIASLALLIRRERRVANPLFELELLRRPVIWRTDAMAACHGATIVSLITFLPIYVYIHLDLSASQTGFMLVPFMIGLGTCSMLTGRAVSRTGWTMIFPSVSLIGAVGLLAILGIFGEDLGQSGLFALLFALGATMGTVMGVVQVTIQTAAGRASLGAASASVQVSRSLGASVGTALVSGVLFTAMALADPQVAELFKALIQKNAEAMPAMSPERLALIKAEIVHAFGAAFLTIAAFAAICLVLAWTHPQRRI